MDPGSIKLTSGQGTRSARCGESRTPGAEGGPRETAGGNTSTAPAGLPYESAAIKLSSVVTDLHGETGRDIMDHLIAGERNPKTLAQLARARARRKITELEQALEGAEF